ncbi:MAG: methylaspartate ammonia-lyase [Firmicutes bacterium]|nr:methylaspartate ammonia-lyase [Bacillota bacterium]
MKVTEVLAAPGLTGFFYDDQRAIKAGAESDGFAYRGAAVTPGFRTIRQRGESLSLLFKLDDGSVVWGDCAAVQYSGAGGRDPLFLADVYAEKVLTPLREFFVGREIAAGFRETMNNFYQFCEETDFPRHAALRYGISQAVLAAVAQARRLTMAEVIADEFSLTPHFKPVPVFCQTGDERYVNADKMILKGVDVIPHGLINNIPDKLGARGEKLLDYIQWLRDRCHAIGAPGYKPVLHIDVYGTLGLAFENDLETVAQYLVRAGAAAGPLQLRIEGPVDMEDKGLTIQALAELRQRVEAAGSSVEIVADEWCNTLEDIKDFADAGAGHMLQIKTPDLGGVENLVEAVRYCKQTGLGAYLGGTCNETDQSARVCVNIAVATGPDQMLAKPGMGVDEGLMVVYNEMQRVLAIINSR